MARKPKQTPLQTCADCVHEYACKQWTHGQELSPGNASICDAFETVRDTAAYLIGKMEANEKRYSNQTKKAEDCRYYTPNSFWGSGCLGTKEIDPCEGGKCERWKPKEE